MRSLRPFILALSLLLAAGCGSDSHEATIASGKAYMDKGDNISAAIEFKSALAKQPDSGELRFLLGTALSRSGNLAGGEIELRKALASGYAPDEVTIGLVETLLENGKFDEVISEAKPDSAGTASASAALHALVGQAWLSKRADSKAREAFDLALRKESASIGGKLGMARLLARQGKWPEAYQFVDDVLASKPESFDATRLKADMLVAEGRSEESIALYGKAIAMRPTAALLYMSAVPLLVGARNFEQANAWLTDLKKTAPGTPIAQYLEALLAYAKDDKPRCRDLLRTVLNSVPDFPQALLLAGQVELDLGGLVQATDHLQKVVAMMPNAPYPRRLLITAYSKSGQLDRALESIAPLMKISPDDPASLYVAGEVSLSAHDTTKAVEYLEKAVAHEPKNVIYRTRLALAHLAAGATKQGTRELEAISAEDSDNFEADVTLVSYYLTKKEWDNASAALNGLRRKQPQNPLSLNMTGLALLGKGDKVGAAKAWAQAIELSPGFYPALQNLALLDIENHKYADAKARYEVALAKDPRNGDALLALVNIALRSGATNAEIEAAINRVIAADPTSERGYVVKVDHLLRLGDTTRALAAATEATSAAPNSALIMSSLAQAQMAAGESSQAATTYGKLAALAPRSAAPLLGQAEAFIAMQDWTSAIDALRAATDRDPSSFLGLAGLVKVGIVAKRYDVGRKAAEAMLKQFPSNGLGYVLDADVLSAQGKRAEAEQILRTGLAKLDVPVIAYRLYGQLCDAGRADDGWTFLSGWIAKHPGDLGPVNFAAQFHAKRKEYVAAARWYKSALASHPNDPVLLNNLAWALGEANDASAYSYAEKAMALAPKNGEILETAGSLAIKNGRVGEGLGLLGKAVQASPRNASIKLSYAHALLDADKRKEAQQQLNDAEALPLASVERGLAAKLRDRLK